MGAVSILGLNSLLSWRGTLQDRRQGPLHVSAVVHLLRTHLHQPRLHQCRRGSGSIPLVPEAPQQSR